MQIKTSDTILEIVICLSVFGILVLLGEFLRRKKIITGELARKFVHTTSGTWAALWPILLDLKTIALLSLALTLVAVILRATNLLKSVYSIKRISIGEILIGFGMGLAAWFAKSGSVYSAAVLVISWSDSMAAIVGTRFGKNNSFKFLKAKKSIIGSVAFFVTTLLIIIGFYTYEQNSTLFISSQDILFAIMYSAAISVILTITEIMGIYGLDNLTVPILTMLLLNLINIS
jgi:phytol kinase